MKGSILLLVLLFLWGSLHGQNLKVPTLSPFSEIKQKIGLTEITLSYARPSAKGRKIFGELVPFGEIWRTGANASTKLTFYEEVRIAGNDLSAGTYALYSIPNKEEWTIIIHKKTDMRSISGGKVKPENDAFRFKVMPIHTPLKVETFTIQFGNVTTKSCEVQMSWENTLIKFPIEVEVDSKIEKQMAELLKTPETISHRVYFRAAEYYLHNKKDLNQAMKWIDAALSKSEQNYRYALLKSKIYSAIGDKELAINTVKTAYEWAVSAENENYKSQTSVYLETLQKDKSTPPKEDAAADRYKEDVSSLDNILAALYGVISGDKGVKRDWDRFNNLFIEEARLIPSGKGKDGKVGYRMMTPQSYAETSGKWLENNGFHEVEISRKVETYGSLVHVFSTYESYRTLLDAQPFARGINSIQLMNDGERWWIVQIYWLGETKEVLLPEKYLPKK
jgi:tetratricopeptide (TPR) repeat protein